MNTRPEWTVRTSNDSPRRWEITLANRCQSFLRGHNPHWIEVFNVINPAEKFPADVAYVSGNEFLITINGKSFRWFNHQPERLVVALRKAELFAKEDRPHAIIDHPTLLVRSPDGAFIFSMAEHDVGACTCRL